MVYFTSDPHLGHRAICKYRPYFSSPEENTKFFVDFWKQKIKKQDVVYILGDVAFDVEHLMLLKPLRGRKILIKGNHDDYIPTKYHVEIFEEIYGMLSYKGMWLTHCPIHPSEMRKRKANIHGHVHDKTVQKSWGAWKRPDPKYINVCIDELYRLYGKPMLTLDEIRLRIS